MTREQIIESMNTENLGYDEYESRITEYMDKAETVDDVSLLLEIACQRRNEAIVDAITSVLGRRHTFSDIAAHSKSASVDRLLNLLAEMLSQTWHGAHEDLVAELEEFPHPKAIETLRQMVDIKPTILAELDGGDALSRKAIWALGKIASPLDDRKIDPEIKSAALDALNDLLNHPDKLVVERTQKQLDRISEAHR
ncbi:hypothetical protein [Oryzifoliimicrobium ureilyticus]|uniref:hypothetical protein n=1 Tax=Oryzifoliimicrobium ureilyticus TaxID=3113724 RepID=UPI0030766AA5